MSAPAVPAYTVTHTNRFYKSQGEQPVTDLSPEVLQRIDELASLRAKTDPSPSQEELSEASRLVAYELIDMLFRREFSGDGKHWSFDGHSADPLPSDNPSEEEAFEAKEAYCWDWKDIYAVAESKGTVIVNHVRKTIFIKDYGFYCSG